MGQNLSIFLTKFWNSLRNKSKLAVFSSMVASTLPQLFLACIKFIKNGPLVNALSWLLWQCCWNQLENIFVEAYALQEKLSKKKQFLEQMRTHTQGGQKHFMQTKICWTQLSVSQESSHQGFFHTRIQKKLYLICGMKNTTTLSSQSDLFCWTLSIQFYSIKHLYSIFINISAMAIREAAMKTESNHGLSSSDASEWRRILTCFNVSSYIWYFKKVMPFFQLFSWLC